MTTDIDIFRTRGVDVATDEKARRAVKAFRALQPTLTAYARNLTKRKDVVVEMAARDNGSTDGKKIYYRPPIALGEDRRHERRLCDKRDPATKDLLCEACSVREEVLVTIYHEIGHIAFDSFAKVSAEDFLLTMEKAIEEVGTKYAKQIKAALDAAPLRVKSSYIGISNYVSPFLPFLVNCLEDARVNTEMFKARPGTKVMFDTSTTKIFREGVEQVDRTTGEIIVKKWSEYPLNAQASIGVFCIASGYSYEEWFAPQVIEALRDEKLNQLVKSIDSIRSAAGVYQLSFPVLARLRELGFCKSDRDPENEEEQDDQQDADSGGNDRQEPGSEGDPDEADKLEGESSDSGSEAGESGASGASDDQDDDGSTDPSGDGSEGDAGLSAGDGADADSSGSELDTDEESVDESGAAEETGTSEGSDELGSESGDSSDDTDPSDAMEADDADEAGESPLGEAGTGTVGDNQELEEGSGGGQAAESSREDQQGEDDDSDGESSGDDLGSAGEQESAPEGTERTPLDGDGSDSDESTDAGGSDSSDSTDAIETDAAERPGDQDESGTPDSRGEDGAAAHDGNRELSDAEDGDTDPFDSGADDGTGGIDLIEKEEFDDIPLGTPEEVEWALHKLGDHEEKPTSVEEQETENAVDRAIIQGLYFETPSRNIYGVREHKHGEPVIVDGYNTSQAWDTSGSAYVAMGFRRRQLGRDGDFSPSESTLGAALVRMRVAFSDNKRGSNERNLKAGKVNSKVLGKRAWNNDERLFRRKTQPGKKDYFVVIGMDVSGSTVGRNIVLEKQAVMAQAELLKRMGIKFSIFAHSGNLHSPGVGRSGGMDLDVYFIKEHNEPWDDKIKQRLVELGPDSSNLDGHFLEYLRKVAEKVPATDKVILYYSDGKMPAENHDEELEILQREIRYCATRAITLLGVGIRTDSPSRHGLDTVQVDTDEDIVKVVRHLERRLH